MSEVNSGLPGVGGVPWGSHFCQLYEGRDDLVEVLVPFFKAGIEADERCLWITAEPFGVDDATAALKSAVADLDGRLARKQIEIIDHRAWYQGGRSVDDVVDAWLGHEADALARGYRGLRLAGNTSWIDPSNAQAFAAYEAAANAHFAPRRIVALCSYCLARRAAVDFVDAVSNHHFAIRRRDQRWERIDGAAVVSATGSLRPVEPVRREDSAETPPKTPPKTLGDVLYAASKAVVPEAEWRRSCTRSPRAINSPCRRSTSARIAPSSR